MLENVWSDLSSWFSESKRDLPWRKSKTPYSVWVSEIMLQQTQVDVVIPYFLRWMEAFPSIEALASSDESAVIKQWEGLGYYSRARNLHKGAKFVMEHHDGSFPTDAKELIKIPGIGPYTVGAILSFAFHQRAPAVDGNVMRVISRLQALEADTSKEKTKKEIHQFLEKHFPEKEPWVVAEGLIELGAMICKKEPLCIGCPVQAHCLAKKQGRQLSLPYKGKKTVYERLNRHVGIIMCDQDILVRKCPDGEIMAGLYEFPYIDQKDEDSFEEHLQAKLELKKVLPKVQHSFTRFRVTLHPHLYETLDKKIEEHMEWIDIKELQKKPFSSGHRRILRHLVKL